MWQTQEYMGSIAFKPLEKETQKVYYRYKDMSFEEVNGKDDNYFYNDKVYYNYKPMENVLHTVSELPPGVYKAILIDHEQWLYLTTSFRNETIINNVLIQSVIDDFNSFVKSKDIYERLGFMHKRGVLLFGPPGTGKTTAINQIIHKIRPENSVVLWLGSQLEGMIVDKLNKEDKLKIIVFEELTNFVEDQDELFWILNFLDGENSLNNCFSIAATNYPEKLPKNITERPGRFDSFYKLGYLEPDDIKQFLELFLQCSLREYDLTLFVDTTIAQLKELVLIMKRDSKNIEDAYKFLLAQKDLAKRAFSELSQIGFISFKE